MTVGRERFEELAQEAFDNLPHEFKKRIENVQIVIEDYPDDETQQNMHVSRHNLLGLYQGVPLKHRGSWYGMVPTVPDRITLYQTNIEARSKTEEEIERNIAEVLFHEIGHHFGMNEKEIRASMKNFDY